MSNFEDNLQRIEKVVEKLEKGNLSLDEALGLFEEGVMLSNACKQELDAAEGKIEMLLKQNGKIVIEAADDPPETPEIFKAF